MRDAAEDDRAMRDRFVPRHGDIALHGVVNRFDDAFHNPTLRDLAPYLVSPSKLFFQPRARAVFNPTMQSLQIMDVVAQGSAECVTVHQTNVAPQLRAARSDTREILETTG